MTITLDLSDLRIFGKIFLHSLCLGVIKVVITLDENANISIINEVFTLLSQGQRGRRSLNEATLPKLCLRKYFQELGTEL